MVGQLVWLLVHILLSCADIPIKACNCKGSFTKRPALDSDGTTAGCLCSTRSNSRRYRLNIESTKSEVPLGLLKESIDVGVVFVFVLMDDNSNSETDTLNSNDNIFNAAVEMAGISEVAAKQ